MGAVVGIDKKVTGGTNKAHQSTRPSTYIPHNQLTDLFLHCTGTDHQKIAKIDRENEVAPPPKISPSVGKVRDLRACSPCKF